MVKDQNLAWMLWQIPAGEEGLPPAYHLVNAIRYFIEKYGQVPNRCEAPQTWQGVLDDYEGVVIAHSKHVQQNSLMLAFDAAQEPAFETHLLR